MIPPLGSLLNPFHGIVQNEKISNDDLNLNYGRQDSIEILFDERRVPHIFSDSQNDLFFAQGFVTASERLWQMDFLSYISAGRLSEIFGKQSLDADRRQRRSGILFSAIVSLKFIEATQESKQALDSYTEGVNKYIEGLSDANLPIEYKLMAYHPEPWTNLKSVLIMKYMGAILSGFEEDVSSSYLLEALGKKEFDNLFSSYYINDTLGKFSILRVKDSLLTKTPIGFLSESASLIPQSPFNPRLGSNSWAISPKKSVSGSAILCNDPHLNLTFPAVWFELQLHSDDMNVYGYSIPGTPGVIIGYNENISWGLTNGSTDVYDLFKLELKDDYSQYKFDGSWRNTEKRIEEIKIKGNKSFYDTIFYSVHGPIASDRRFGEKEKQGFAIKWTLYDPSNEFLAFIKLNKASNYSEFRDAIRHYKCPVQNFTYADVKGNIATHHQGKITKSHSIGRGKFILDGTRSDNLSTEVLLSNELPFVHNPAQGFVCSANNNPFHETDSFAAYGHYYELRASKIKQCLSREGKFTLKDMKLMQLDNTNRLAELAIPILSSFISKGSNEYAKKLSEWDYKCNKETQMGLIFENWWNLVQNNTWDELSKFKKAKKNPDDLILLDMIRNDSSNKYFDILSTNKKETAGDIIRLSLKDATRNLRKPLINWGDNNKVDIMHLSNFRKFSKMGISSSGHPNAINAISKNWGPSLRFIVEMNKKPQGYGVYAGGQSGNPGSSEYDRFVDDWVHGEYYKLNFFLSKNEGESHTTYKWIIK